MSAVNVLVTCSARKTLRGGPALRDVMETSVEERAAVWTSRLSLCGGQRVRACQLYAGEHWSIVKSLPGIGGPHGFEVVPWICSAGYGLIAWNTPVQTYGATFAYGHPDSVVSGGAKGCGRLYRERWWTALGQWPGPSPGNPRTLADLVSRTPSDPVIIAASSDYLQAILCDLKNARAEMRPGAAMIVLTCDERIAHELNDVSVLCDARLQAVVGGSRISLLVRTLRVLLRETAISLDAWRDRIRAISKARPSSPNCARSRLTDEEVRLFITREWTTDPSGSHSTLLRKLRDGGKACEQGRFREIYKRFVRKASQT